MILDAHAQTLNANFPLGCVATTDAEGRPCVSPKGTFLALDADTLAFGNIRSPGTLRNFRSNPATEVNFADPFTRKALRARGHASIHGRGSDMFDRLLQSWIQTWGDFANRISSLVVIALDEASHIATPPYDDGVTEDKMIALYKSKYAALYP